MKYATILITSALLVMTPVTAQAFSLKFDWSDLKKCTNGKPKTVKNPVFKLSDVPGGTTKLKFKLRDMNVRSYNHGGGTVSYANSGTIAPGAFKYKSPCPPNGKHTYQWTVTALDANNSSLGKATAKKSYP